MAKTAPVPVIKVDHAQATAAWEAYQAMCRAEAKEPALRDNAAWLILRQDAYAQFYQAFEGRL